LRTLLILDGTNLVDEALTDARVLCDPGDKLTILAVAEKPPGELIGSRPSPVAMDPYTGGTVGGVGTHGGSDVPVFESDDDTEARVAGELRDRLDEHLAEFEEDEVELWTQAIVRDAPGEAVAAYVRSSDVARIVLPRSSLTRLQKLLEGSDGKDTLQGRLAPVIVLPA
jgi:nucleotide-binding universal stress UspA family protein